MILPKTIACVCCAAVFTILAQTPAFAANDMTSPATLLENCERIATGRLGVHSNRVSLDVQTVRVDGSIPVNGSVSGTNVTFQCNFDSKGKPGDFWNSKGIEGCPADLSEADRWLFPDC